MNQIWSQTKIFARTHLPRPVFRVLKHWHRYHQIRSHGPHSAEEETTLKWLAQCKASSGYFVDIAAQDGIAGSQTLRLAKLGWRGLAVECDADYFAALSHFYARYPQINLVRSFISPGGIVSLLKGCACPREFEFLSLDIDSFDYEVLDAILSFFRPKLICCEINEVMPPPLAFRVKHSEDQKWEGGCFQGQSIAMCARLASKYRYSIGELYYNNLFLVPAESLPGEGLSVEEAYQAGYMKKSDRLKKFPWNRRFESIHGMSDSDKLKFFEREFQLFQGRFELEMENTDPGRGSDTGISQT